MNFQCRSATPALAGPLRGAIVCGEQEDPAFVGGREGTDTIVTSQPRRSSSLLFFPLGLTAVSHQNWCLKDIAKVSVSVSQLVSQAANNLLATRAVPDLIGTAGFMPVCPCGHVWRPFQGEGPCQPHSLWGCWWNSLPGTWGAGGGENLPRTATLSSEGDRENPGPVTRETSQPSVLTLPPARLSRPHTSRSKKLLRFILVQT